MGSNHNQSYYIYLNTESMVDRYQSLLGGEQLQEELPRNIRADTFQNINRQIVQRTNSHATKMRQYITRYKRNVGNDATQIINDFKKEQTAFVKDRNILKSQLDKLQKNSKKDTAEYNFMKKELLRAVKNQIDLQLQLNQEVSRQKEEKQKWKDKLLAGSPLLANALKDIEAKRADILYLEKQIIECLQLLEIIGILTNQTGEKLDLICDRVKQANYNIELAQANIDKAKIAMQKSRCKMCCIILLALIAIALILVVLFGAGIVHL